MKKKSIDNVVKYAAMYLHSQGKTHTEIATELNISAKEAKGLISTETTEKNKESKNAIKTTSSPVNSKNLMITQTEGKKIKSVAIMTKAASEVNDEFKKSLTPTVSRTGKEAIFRPNTK